MSSKMEFNWSNDYGVNEQLHYFSQNISARYGMLFFNNQNGPLANQWNEMGIKWARYNFAIKDLFLETKEEADLEIAKLVKELQSIIELEKTLTN